MQMEGSGNTVTEQFPAAICLSSQRTAVQQDTKVKSIAHIHNVHHFFFSQLMPLKTFMRKGDCFFTAGHLKVDFYQQQQNISFEVSF